MIGYHQEVNVMEHTEKKKTRTLLSNAAYMFRKVFKNEKRVLVFSVLSIPLAVALTLLSNYMASYAVKMITEGTGYLDFVKFILGIAALIFIIKIASNLFGLQTSLRALSFRFRFAQEFTDKTIDTDYENVESADGKNKAQKARNGAGSDSGPIQASMKNFVSLMSNVLGIITYSAIIILLSPWIIIILLALTAAIFFLNRYYNNFTHQQKDELAAIRRKEYYIINTEKDFAYAKDIRLYHIGDWFKSIGKSTLAHHVKVQTRQETRRLLIHVFTAALAFLRDGAAYAFLIYKIVYGGMDAAEFVWYFTVISQYADYFYGIANDFIAFHAKCLYFSDARDWLEIEEHTNRNIGIPVPSGSPEIEFRNVSFSYPGSANPTIDKLSFKISSGEKCALVGLNGAGKTTIVKLLCGLYTQYTGQILVGGHEIKEYNTEEYQKILAVVFQNIAVLPVSIACNIAVCESKSIDYNKLRDALIRSGLNEKVQSLPDKAETLLGKSVSDNAIDLSGGEMQKLALARALYKGGQMLVLDEPTAALDPIAENNMYITYGELTRGATSLFISHRLSSTRFCDRIFYLENGEIAECGTHDELMTRGGKYAQMFEIQSKYYKESEKDDKA